MLRPRAVWIPFLMLGTGCVSTSRTIPPAWLSVPEAPRIRSVALAADGKVTTSADAPGPASSDGPIRVVRDEAGARIANGVKLLTDLFLDIESLDFSEARGEVAFSAKRDDDFDIGLVSSDGSPISWVPADPADEIAVQWAPRGSKISYVIRAGGGDVVRTLHVPTSFQFGVPFDYATVHALAWDPPAERYAAAYSTLTASDAVDVLEYSGEKRRTAVPPVERLDVQLEPLGDAMLLRPRDLRYGEKIPLVVWQAAGYGWNDARAALMRNARVAIAVTRRLPDEAFWNAAAAIPWLDARRAFIVSGAAAASAAESARNAILITGDQALTGGRYRRSGNVLSVPPAVVQSFAAGFIADSLERTTPANGSSR